MIIVALVVIVFFAIYILRDNSKDVDVEKDTDFVNKVNDSKEIVDNKIFCEAERNRKFYYEEKYYDNKEDMNLILTSQRYFKITDDKFLYFERLTTDSYGVGTWNVATIDSYIVYSNRDGECSAIRHNVSSSPFFSSNPKYYYYEITEESKVIENSEIGWKTKENIDIGKKLNATIVTFGDYINKEFCIPLTQEIVNASGSSISYSTKLNFKKDFSDSIFDLPEECKRAPVIDMEMILKKY